MNKKHLYLASSLLSVLLLSGVAVAQAADSSDTTKAMEVQNGRMTRHMGKGMMSKLSEDGQKTLKESMAGVHEANKAHYEEIKKLREEIKELLKAPSFDKEAYLLKGGDIQKIEQSMRSARDEAFASAAEKMSVEDRTQLASRGPHSSMMGGKKGKKGMGSDDCPNMGAGMGMGMGPGSDMMDKK